MRACTAFWICHHLAYPFTEYVAGTVIGDTASQHASYTGDVIGPMRCSSTAMAFWWTRSRMGIELHSMRPSSKKVLQLHRVYSQLRSQHWIL